MVNKMDERMKIEDVIKYLEEVLVDLDYWPDVIECGEDVTLTIDDNNAFCRKLILKGVTDMPVEKEGYFLNDCSIEKKNDIYCMKIVLEEPCEEICEEFSLCFAEAEESVEVYNCIKENLFFENPWRYIQDVAEQIIMKSKLREEYFNEQEKAMLPLLEELVENRYDIKKSEKILSLCKKEKEPEWRDLYNKLVESQKKYKDKTSQVCEAETLNDIRKYVEDILRQHGYRGNYPDFEKRASVKGIHLEKSYDVAYFVGNKKNVLHCIHCIESAEESGYFTIQFLCGTAFLKEGEKDDVYGCLFNANGKRLFYTLHAYIKLGEQDKQRITDELEESINIAVKKTELKRLTKKERILYRGIANGNGIIDFLSFFIIGGGLYGIIMTVGMALLGIMISVIAGQVDKIPALIEDMPWGILLAIGWIGFGGVMGVINVLADRK